jgi:GAF domain-containing protein
MTPPPAGPTTDLECLREILALARQQAAALEADSIDRFGELLEARSALVSRLETAPTDGDAFTLEFTAREIIELDRLNQAVLGDRLRQVRTELPILAAGSRVATAYRQNADASPAYVDRAS